MNADVQGAPNRRAEHRDVDGENSAHLGTGGTALVSSGAAAGSVGSGQSGDSRRTPMSPVGGTSWYGMREGSSGTPRISPAAPTSCHDCGRRPVLFVNSATI